jgi:adenylate cyclase
MIKVKVKGKQQEEIIDVPAGRTVVMGRRVDAVAGEIGVALEDPGCSRRQLRATAQSDGAILVENLSSKVTIKLVSGQGISPRSQMSLDSPAILSVAGTVITLTNLVTIATPEPDDSQSLMMRTVNYAPMDYLMRQSVAFTSLAAETGENINPASLVEWFETLIAVQRSAVGSEGFYMEIADALVRLIGLTYGMVLLTREGGWRIVAVSGVSEKSATFSQTVLNLMKKDKRTIYDPIQELGSAESLMSLSAVVTSPIFSADNSAIIGAVYGVRVTNIRTSQKKGISDLEAQLVQLLAASAATGLARSAKEAEATKLRVQFEEFCSAEIVRELQQNPQLLEAADREISVLFCDVRGFSGMSEKMDPRLTFEIMTDILDGLTESVLRRNGVVIDFYGDAIAAMWNAPCAQDNHEQRALDCALEISRQIQLINKKWQDQIEGTLRVGIGIHSGSALVGNVGGQRRIKYGPRGTTVNIASRIEGLTKYLGTEILLSGRTVSALSIDTQSLLRLGEYQVVGIKTPVELYTLIKPEEKKSGSKAVNQYLKALEKFEEGEIQTARAVLSESSSDFEHSQIKAASAFLYEEIQGRLQSPQKHHTPYISVESK